MEPNVPDYNLNTKIFDFPTGLRIMMQSDSSHPVVTAWMLVNHGTADDPQGKEETAHFVEHMWFRSKHGTLPPVMQVIQDIGALFNATTRNDWTDYRTVASNQFLPALLKMESLRLTNFYEGVTEEEIDVEREVIRNEWRRRSEQGPSLLFEFLYEAVYPQGHGYHNHSNHDSIDNIKLKDLQAYVDRYYKPENATVFVVGDFDPEEASSLIFENFAPELLHEDLTEEMFFSYPREGIDEPDPENPAHWLTGAWDPADFGTEEATSFQYSSRPDARISEQRPPVPELGSPEVLEVQGPLDYKTVVVGWSLPGGYRSDHYQLIMVGNTASQYVSAAFGEERDQRRIRDVACFSQPEVRNTTVMCYAEIVDKEMDPLRVRDKMLDQLSQIWNPENFTPNTINGEIYRQSLQRAKMENLADLVTSLDLYALQFGGRAELIAPHAHYTNRVQAHSDGMRQVLDIDPGVISELAHDHLQRDRAATVVITPLDEEDIDIGSEHSTYKGANATDQVVRTTDDMSQVTADQIISSYVVPDLEDIQDFTLENGLRVVILPHGEAPVVKASLVVSRDNTTEPKGMYDFVSWFTDSEGHDPLPIAASPNFPVWPAWALAPDGTGKPLFVDPRADRWGDAVRISYRAPSGNLDGALWLLREEIETAQPYIDGKTAYIKDERTALKINWATRTWHISRVSNDYLYPDSLSAREMQWEDIDLISSWNSGDVNDYLGRHLRPDNATLLIVGNIDPADARTQAQDYFGGWQARRSAGDAPGETTAPTLPTESSKIVIFDDAERTQTQVTTRCRLNYTDEEQDSAVDVLSSLLGNRTFDQLRVKEGLAYSPGAASFVSDDGSATLAFYSLAVNSGVGRTVQFFNEAISEVEAGEVDEEEVVLHKLRRARSEGVAAQSMDQVTAKLTEAIRKDKDWDFVLDQGDLIGDVDKDDLRELLSGCSAHTITTLEGPAEILTPQLDELGYDYEMYEWRAYGDELLWRHDPKAAKKKEKKRQRDERKAAKKKKKAGDDDEEEDTPAGHP